MHSLKKFLSLCAIITVSVHSYAAALSVKLENWTPKVEGQSKQPMKFFVMPITGTPHMDHGSLPQGKPVIIGFTRGGKGVIEGNIKITDGLKTSANYCLIYYYQSWYGNSAFKECKGTIKLHQKDYEKTDQPWFGFQYKKLIPGQ